jgi:hypothetical protein
VVADSLNPQLLEGAWIASAPRLSELIADTSWSLVFIRLTGGSELRWRIRTALSTGDLSLDDSIRELATELRDEVDRLLEFFGQEIKAPNVQRNLITEMQRNLITEMLLAYVFSAADASMADALSAEGSSTPRSPKEAPRRWPNRPSSRAGVVGSIGAWEGPRTSTRGGSTVCARMPSPTAPTRPALRLRLGQTGRSWAGQGSNLRPWD